MDCPNKKSKGAPICLNLEFLSNIFIIVGSLELRLRYNHNGFGCQLIWNSWFTSIA